MTRPQWVNCHIDEACAWFVRGVGAGGGLLDCGTRVVDNGKLDRDSDALRLKCNHEQHQQNDDRDRDDNADVNADVNAVAAVAVIAAGTRNFGS